MDGGEGGGGLINSPPLKMGGGLIEDLRVVTLAWGGTNSTFSSELGVF